MESRHQLGYCTNVHSGTDMATIRSRLLEFAVPLASALPAGETLGVGLWLPFSAAKELGTGDQAEEFGRWLANHRLNPFTMNGFPYDNFHLPVVKHAVYKPTWAESSRLDYTVLLARILVVLQSVNGSPETKVASISTLPIGWPSPNSEKQIEEAGKNLRKLSAELASIEKQTGRRTTVAIEPEPGCLFDRGEHVIDFFERHLPDPNHRRYISVCHDICHSAVMFEEQADVLLRYAQAGVSVGKVQVSSAIDVPLSKLTKEMREGAVVQLTQFAEDRYLHQTGCLNTAGEFRLVEDLPLWLSAPESLNDDHLRIHFHVPIFLERFGHLETTRSEIERCVRAMQSEGAPEFTGHWEVETYAWTVMPEEMRAGGLGNDIGNELNWFRQLLQRQNVNDSW